MFKSEWLKRQDILRSFVANSFAAKVLVIVNKFILFWFLFIKSGRYKNKKTRDYQEQRRMGLRMFGSKLFFMPHICWIFFLSACYVFSFLFLFPGILGNNGLWFYKKCAWNYQSIPNRSIQIAVWLQENVKSCHNPLDWESDFRNVFFLQSWQNRHNHLTINQKCGNPTAILNQP